MGLGVLVAVVVVVAVALGAVLVETTSSSPCLCEIDANRDDIDVEQWERHQSSFFQPVALLLVDSDCITRHNCCLCLVVVVADVVTERGGIY